MELTQYYPTATLGFRQWVIDTDNNWKTAYLESLVFFGARTKDGQVVGRVRWPLDGDLEAACRFDRCEEVPGLEHACGIYAYPDPVKLRTLAIGTDLRKPKNEFLKGSNSRPVVAGLVAGWGTRDLFPRGFKCQRAYILAVFDHEAAYAATRPQTFLTGRSKPGDDRNRPHPDVYQAFLNMCFDHDIPILNMDDMTTTTQAREYAESRGIGLMEDFL